MSASLQGGARGRGDVALSEKSPNHRVLYHHEKQLDKVVRRHNSHDRTAMRRLKFNFIGMV